MESRCRPLGGIATLTLGVAPQSGAAPTLPECGVEVSLLEDRSTYSESSTFIGDYCFVKHTLKVITPIDYALPKELMGGLNLGFIAQLKMNSKAQVNIGWSAVAASDRALRLKSCTTQSGEKPASRGYKEWVFESIDSQQIFNF